MAVMVGMGRKDAFVGNEALIKSGIMRLSYPVQRGMIVNWDDAEKMWHHAFYDQCRMAPEEHPVLIVESLICPKADREKVLQIMFETFNVPCVFLAKAEMMALYASRSLTGVVISLGAGVSFVTPFYEGFPLSHARARLQCAGADLDAQLQILMKPLFDAKTRREMDILRKAKEGLCYIADDFEAEMAKPELEISADFEVPTDAWGKLYDRVIIGRQRFLVPEILFQPSIVLEDVQAKLAFNSQLTSTNVGMHEVVLTSIMSCGGELQKGLFDNIVLCGGSSQIKGLEQRLLKELSHLTCALSHSADMLPSAIRRIVFGYVFQTEHDLVCDPQDVSINISVIPDAVMRGAVTFALSLTGTGETIPPRGSHWAWVSKEEYDETGPALAHYRCFC